jgi:lipoic acid synthetase
MMKPEWIRFKAPSGEQYREVKAALDARGLHTVCDEAQCPNLGECWGKRTATFMIMGKVCTRCCKFCAVATGRAGAPLREDEGEAVARAAAELGLIYIVITSVDRDDLPDRGAFHFAEVIKRVKKELPGVKTEVLVPDYTPEELVPIAEASPDVFAHNIETVPSLQWIRDSRASFSKSVAALTAAKKAGLAFTKSSILLGLGEKFEEVIRTMDVLAEVKVDSLVLGQYLRPTMKQLPVAEFIHPDVFARYAEEAKKKGFARVVSAPFARTSYHASEN